MYTFDFPPQRRQLSGRGRGEGGSSGEAAPVLRFNHTHRRISQRRVRLPDGRNQICALSDFKKTKKNKKNDTEDSRNTQENTCERVFSPS